MLPDCRAAVSRRRRGSVAGKPGAGEDGERQRDAAPLIVPNIRVAAPPVSRMLGDPLDAQARPEERRDDLAEGPCPGELPALLAILDREVVDVLGRPAPRGLWTGE